MGCRTRAPVGCTKLKRYVVMCWEQVDHNKAQKIDSVTYMLLSTGQMPSQRLTLTHSLEGG